MAQLTSPTPDATTTSKGKVQLAGVLRGTAASPGLAVGIPVQVVSTVTSAVATGTTAIPEDDTIPQSTEGDQYMSLAITPKATTNQLVIMATIFMSNSNANTDHIAALFQDSTANALAVNMNFMATATGMSTVTLVHSMAAGTTSATTFKIRAGGNNGATTTFNGQSGARKFGAITKSSITILEYGA